MCCASKCFMICLLSLTLGATASENSIVTDMSNRTCFSDLSITKSEGDTLQLIYTKSLMESDVNFRGYRLSRNGQNFAYEMKGSQCLNWSSKLEQNLNILSKKMMFDCNSTHLKVEIENASLQDSGNYTNTHVFDGVKCNFLDTKKVTVTVIVVPSSEVLNTMSTSLSAPKTVMPPISVGTAMPVSTATPSTGTKNEVVTGTSIGVVVAVIVIGCSVCW